MIARLRAEKGAFFHTYGSPRMHAELRMGHGFRIGRNGWSGSSGSAAGPAPSNASSGSAPTRPPVKIG